MAAQQAQRPVSYHAAATVDDHEIESQQFRVSQIMDRRPDSPFVWKIATALLTVVATAFMVSTIVLASDNSAGSTTVTVTTPTDLFTATTQLWGGFNSGPKFDGEEYQSKSASEKMSQLWGSITADTKSSTYSTAKTAAIFLEDLSETFTWVSDTLPRSHKKSIHSVGNVAKMSWKSTGNHPYTGVFKGWTDVLVRMSSAVAPTDTSVAPGMGVKFLRDGEASSNFVAMFSVDGQSELNFFAKTWVNHIPAATTEAPKLLSKKFATKQGGTYGFIEQVGLKDCARPGKVYPYSLSFKPTDAVKNQYPTNTKTSFTDQLSSIEVGTVFFEVYAKAGPSSKSVKIGEMKSTSKFTTSKFGDDELFFQHAYELDDIQSACDAGLPDCNDWLSATHRFTGNTFPFGPSPPPIPSSRRSESGCPLRRALEEKDARINELEAQLKSDA